MDDQQRTTKASTDEGQADEVVPAGRLSGITILLTRPRQQSEEMTAMLEGLGASVIHVPMIELKEPESWQALDESIHQLDLYDWLIFTSVNGVKYFFQRLAKLRPEPMATLTGASLCAIGLATAKALEQHHVRVDLVATEAHAEGLLKALLFYLGSLQALPGLRFLLPRARHARELIPDELRKMGARVDVVEAYQNVMPEMAGQGLLQLFKDRRVDVITFTSSSTVENFVTLIGREQLPRLLEHSRIACIGPVTKATAEAYGLRQIIQPQTSTAEAFVEAIVRAIGE
jgi:uroporphyrinogen III methyltransferase / synthase